MGYIRLFIICFVQLILFSSYLYSKVSASLLAQFPPFCVTVENVGYILSSVRPGNLWVSKLSINMYINSFFMQSVKVLRSYFLGYFSTNVRSYSKNADFLASNFLHPAWRRKPRLSAAPSTPPSSIRWQRPFWATPTRNAKPAGKSSMVGCSISFYSETNQSKRRAYIHSYMQKS